MPDYTGDLRVRLSRVTWLGGDEVGPSGGEVGAYSKGRIF
jgi:hypothetical protein